MKKFAGFVNRQVDFKDPRAFEFYVYIYIVKDGYLKTEVYDKKYFWCVSMITDHWSGRTSLWYSKNLLMLTTMEKTRMAMEIIVAVFRGNW